ncbi:MAG: hypothetical protein AB2392_21760 [Neobacillus sp.]
MKNKLRIIWIIPNVICYFMFIASSFFVFSNIKELEEVGRLTIWFITLLLLLFVSLLGSYRISSWIKEGKL